MKSIGRLLPSGLLAPMLLACVAMLGASPAGAAVSEISPVTTGQPTGVQTGVQPGVQSGEQQPSGTISGWVGVNTTPDGKPAPYPGVQVSFFAKTGTWTWAERGTAWTNSGGNYSITLPAGDYTVLFHHVNQDIEWSWYNGPATGGFVADGAIYQTEGTVLRLKPGGTITRVSAGMESLTVLLAGR